MTTLYKHIINAQKRVDIDILSGQTISDVVVVNGMTPVGLLIPVAPTGATFTFQASFDGTNFYTLRDIAGANLTLTTGVGYFKLNPSDFDGVDSFRVVSASAEAATRSMILILADYKV